jgi:hypothetical protein
MNFILKYSTYQNSEKNSWYIFFNIPYVVSYRLAKFELKSPLVHREIKRQIVLKG